MEWLRSGGGLEELMEGQRDDQVKDGKVSKEHEKVRSQTDQLSGSLPPGKA